LRTGDENRVISPLVVLEGIEQLLASHSFFNGLKWWPGTELNRRRQPFQGCALPPELPGHVSKPAHLPRAARIVHFTLIVAGLPTG
jgi:hypothetical protein